MTTSSSNFVLYDAFGQNPIDLPPPNSGELVLSEMQVGVAALTFGNNAPLNRFTRDARLGVFRSINGGQPRLVGDTYWLIRKRQCRQSKQNGRTVSIRALHSNSLLARRIVAYYAASSQASKSGAADNLIKAIARESLGSGATDALGDTTRALSTALFSIDADTTSAPTIDKSFAWRNVLTTLQEIAQSAAQAGVYVGFEVVAVTEQQFRLRTYIKQRGVDHTITSADPVVFGPQYGNIGDYTLDEDWNDETTFVYAGGQGEGTDRTLVTAQNTSIIGQSPFGRNEYFRDARQMSTSSAVSDEADGALYEQRARVTLTANTNDTPGTTFGIHYDWGDLTTAEIEDVTFTARIDPVRLTFSREGGDQSDIKLRNDQ